jgi:hypothetical protein
MEELFSKAMELLLSVEGASVTIAIVFEFIFRMLPTKEPLTWLVLIAKGCKMVGELLIKVSSIMDKVLPQRLK